MVRSCWLGPDSASRCDNLHDRDTLGHSRSKVRLSVDEIAGLGVRRISLGGALALAAWTGFVHAAQTLMSEGSFAGLARLVPYAEIDGLFAADLPGHQRQTV